MKISDTYKKFQEMVDQAQSIVIVQAANPDVDSLGSALALNQLCQDLSKQTSLYCPILMPKYLQFLANWEQVSTTWSDDYDLAIMVDNSSLDLLAGRLSPPEWQERLSQRKLIIVDHHPAISEPAQADLVINQPEAVATGQVIYQIAKAAGWEIRPPIANNLTASILSDSLGFSSQAMKDNSQPLRVVADLVDLGADLPRQSQDRLRQLRISPTILAYKAELLQRIEFSNNNRVATLSIGHDEIKRLAGQFNPTVVLDEMRLVEGVRVSIGFKKYLEAGRLIRLTARIRCHDGSKIAQDLATHFGGGGHAYAAGAKWLGYDLDFEDILNQVLAKTDRLLETEDGEA